MDTKGERQWDGEEQELITVLIRGVHAQGVCWHDCAIQERDR